MNVQYTTENRILAVTLFFILYVSLIVAIVLPARYIVNSNSILISINSVHLPSLYQRIPELNIIGFLIPLAIAVTLVFATLKKTRMTFKKFQVVLRHSKWYLLAGIVCVFVSVFVRFFRTFAATGHANLPLSLVTSAFVCELILKGRTRYAFRLAYVLGFLSMFVGDIQSNFFFIGEFGGNGLYDGDFVAPLALLLASLVLAFSISKVSTRRRVQEEARNEVLISKGNS